MRATRTRLNLIKHLKSVNRQFIKVMLPSEVYYNLHVFIEMCAYNGIDVPRFFSFIFSIGYELFLSFYHQGNMKSISEMLVCVRYMRKMFTEILQFQGREWYLNPDAALHIIELCQNHGKDINDFFTFIDSNKIKLLGKDNLLITRMKAVVIFEYYLQGNL